MQRTWEEFYKSHNYFHLEPHEYLPAFVNKCVQTGTNKVLDLGCGAGADLLYLAERGLEVVGVDYSPSAAANAEDLLQSKGLNGKVYVDNLFDRVTTFLPKEFPAVVAINSLEYTDLETFKSTLAEISQILADRGLLLLIVSSTESPVKLSVSEQLFFKADELTELVRKRFNILDMAKDRNNCHVVFLEKH